MDGSSPDRLAAAEQQASDRLEELHEQLIRSNDHLYQHLALYLQVLREGLLPLVQQACFHLVTTVPAPAGSASTSAANAYAALPESDRLRLQQRIRQLVERCCCLLTVEQLMALATQRLQQEHTTRLQRRQHLLEALQSNATGAEPEPPAEPRPAAQRESSIHLGLDLPISADLFTHGLPGLAGLAGMPSEGAAAGSQDASDLPSLSVGSGEGPPSGAMEAGGSLESGPQAAGALSGMEALMALAAAGADLLTTMAEESQVDADDGQDGLLPRDPEKLLQWWQQFDLALIQRLRHLSHALNGLLLRSGLIRARLPLPLLEAVLSGQLEPLPAPANLVRLPIPLPQVDGATSERLETVLAVLLRPSDLEFEHPPLRTCRQRLEAHRRQVRRMSQHHRDWQRRHQSIQAQRLWETDINGTPNPPAAGP